MKTLDIEITYDLKELDMETYLVMDRRHEILEDGDYIRWVRRIVERDDLYIYHHAVEGTFNLVQMLWWEPRCCSEIVQLLGPPDRGGWLPASIIKARCKYGNDLIEEFQRDVRKQKQNRNEKLQLNEDTRKDLMAHHRLHGRPELATAIGTSSYVAPENRTDASNELASELARKARGRVVNLG